MQTEQLLPRALVPGDTIGIAAPASPVREDLLALGEQVLIEMGFVIRRSQHVLRRARYTAGTIDERASDFNDFLRDPQVRAILVARGGYGSPQLLPLLDRAALLRDPKIVMGASDATALLLWALAAGVACVHGPMPARAFQEGRVDREEVLAHLTRATPYGTLISPGLRALHAGHARGALTGGCLSLVVSSLGTPWEIDTENTILFLEDTDTKPYQIDRMLTQLRLAGKLASIRGLCFGEMPRCTQVADQGYTLDEVLSDLTGDLGVPVVAGVPSGHTSGTERPLPFGVTVSLDADRRTLTFEQAVVRY